ncbi:hypothetical protein BFW38_12460 [Terasakiispira papahanaumokuakeensis]|uniref:Penicillin-binding protein 1A n=1 Tax=Terasakiispira papahanaumokuakeensis TaxID=197479 RepID=A0A1E2VB69_9GAMM|nr:penicillin-binding protein 1A [Terasakiispira papahanaumokuakeensis]ODC04221.1 hypothetical protein BFW38_12460 [Terasakiispira papahanaumokuakeensis]
MARFKRCTAYLLWAGLALFAAMSAGALGVALYYWPGLQDEVAQLQDLDELLNTQLETPLRVYSADNKLIASFGEHRRERIHYNEIPEAYIKAILAAEDSAFFSHHGVDPKGLLRAAWQLVSTGHIQSGGSTITMQVARNYLLTLDRTFTRKIREILLSLRMEQMLSKQQIMELYVNKIYLGNRAYGIAAAADVYYGKPIGELDLAQLAMIAGLPKAPSAYNPLANPRRALIRRNWILSRMLELGEIEQPAYAEAVKQPITATYHAQEVELKAPYVAEAARSFAVEKFGPSAYTRGLRVYTTVTSEHQALAQRSLQRGLENYDQKHGWRGVEQESIPPEPPQETLDQDALAELKDARTSLDDVEKALEDERARHLEGLIGENVSNWLKVLDSTPLYGGLAPAIVVHTEDDLIVVLQQDGTLALIPREQFDWAGKLHSAYWKIPHAPAAGRFLNRGDLVRIKPLDEPETQNYRLPSSVFKGDQVSDQPKPFPVVQLSQLPDIQGAVVAMKPEDGALTAMVGGFDFNMSKYNRAEQAERQAGSIFKPFIYLAALEKGYTAATVINDAPVVFDDQQLEDQWRPQNSNGTFAGPTRLRKGLYTSRNLVSIRVLDYVGVARAIDLIGRFGFDPDKMPRNLSLALGSANVTPMAMARAYAIMANGGFRISPYLISRIENSNDDVVYRALPPQVCRNCEPDQKTLRFDGQDYPIAPRVVDSRTLYIMQSILRDVIEKGTGRRALALNRGDIRGKTGTTNELRDTWFSGFNSDLAVTVWAGFDNPDTTGEYGASLALPIWIDFMKEALAGRPERSMARPSGIVTVKIDPETGQRARPGQQDAIFELFKSERVPKAGHGPNLDIDTGGEDSGEGRAPDAPAPESLF